MERAPANPQDLLVLRKMEQQICFSIGAKLVLIPRWVTNKRQITQRVVCLLLLSFGMRINSARAHLRASEFWVRFPNTVELVSGSADSADAMRRISFCKTPPVPFHRTQYSVLQTEYCHGFLSSARYTTPPLLGCRMLPLKLCATLPSQNS